MDSDKERRVAATIAALQDRWGNKAIGRLAADQMDDISHVPTGFPALDDALVVGGLPCGRISEINGVPSSGMATIALKIMVKAQAQENMSVYIDLEQSFDPAYAARCGLALDQLVLVRPQNVSQALTILQDFVLGAEVDILVFDTPLHLLVETQASQALAMTLGRLIASLGRTQSVLLFSVSLPVDSPLTTIERPANSALAHFATIRLLVQRKGWLYKQQDIIGYQAQVLVLKNKLGPAGKRADINIVFDDSALDDGVLDDL